jgi:hypothetical protein
MENALLGLAAVVLLLVLCREITCWYLKINATLVVLKEIRDLLQRPAGPAPAASRDVHSRPIS